MSYLKGLAHMAIDKGIVLPNERRIRATVSFDIIVPGNVGDKEFIHRCFEGTRLEIVEIKATQPTNQGGSPR